MENTITWLLIADASKARLFSLHKAKFIIEQIPQHLKLVQQFTHDQSRMKGAELAADKSGEFGRGTFVPESTSPKMQEAEAFALELLEKLKSGKQDNLCRDLIIVAPPAFMGLLHKHMPHEIQKMITQQIEKDYTQHNGAALVQHLMMHF